MVSVSTSVHVSVQFLVPSQKNLEVLEAATRLHYLSITTASLCHPPLSLRYETISDSEGRRFIAFAPGAGETRSHYGRTDMALAFIAEYSRPQAVVHLAFYLNIYVELSKKSKQREERLFY